MGRDSPQNFPLNERFANQTKLELLEIAQATVNQLARRARGRGGEIVLFTEIDRPAPSRGVSGDAAAVDAAADDGDIERRPAVGAPPSGVGNLNRWRHLALLQDDCAQFRIALFSVWNFQRLDWRCEQSSDSNVHPGCSLRISEGDNRPRAPEGIQPVITGMRRQD